jgi:predicted ATPase
VCVADSVRLFVDRASRTGHRFTLSAGNADAVAEICRRLDGLPLAIELAAARTRVLPVTELARRLRDGLDLVSGGVRTVLPHHRTLEATLEWSYRLLAPVEQAVLNRLSLFTGGCDLGAAAVVCQCDDVVEVITSLHDKSLLMVNDQGGMARVSLLETVRQFADAKLVAEVGSSRLEGLRDLHAAWFADVARQLSTGPARGEFAAWLNVVKLDYPNLVAAARRLMKRDASRAVRLLADLAVPDWYYPEAPTPFSALRDALALEVDVSPGDRAILLMQLTEAYFFGMLAGDGAASHREAELILKEEVSAHSRATALPTVIFQRAFVDDRRLGDDEIETALAVADAVDPFLYGYRARSTLADVSRPALGVKMLAEAAAVADRHGHAGLADQARAASAWSLATAGDSDAALAVVRTVFSVMLDDPTIDAERLFDLALIEGEHGDLRMGVTLAEDIAARLSRRSLPAGHAGGAWAVVGHLRRLAGDLRGAEAAVELAAAGLSTMPPMFVRALNAITWSALNRDRGNCRAAASGLVEFVRGWVGATDAPMRLLEETAAIALGLGRVSDAADLFATAAVLRIEYSMPVTPARQQEVEVVAERAGTKGRILAEDEVRTVLAHMAAD